MCTMVGERGVCNGRGEGCTLVGGEGCVQW